MRHKFSGAHTPYKSFDHRRGVRVKSSGRDRLNDLCACPSFGCNSSTRIKATANYCTSIVVMNRDELHPVEWLTGGILALFNIK